MQKILFSVLLTGLLVFCFSQAPQDGDRTVLLTEYKGAEKIYLQAGRLAKLAGENEIVQDQADEKYRQALTAFNKLIPRFRSQLDDSLAFFTHLKTAYIQYYFDSAAAAKKEYLALIRLYQKLPAVADSFLFIPYLYTGGIYYNQNQTDSAVIYYKKAESINALYNKPLNESQRLYNRLGALYYESGNYRQARNYFEKAIALTPVTDNILLTNYKINLASIFIKLEEYEKATAIYESLLPSPAYENELYHNLGIISLKQLDYEKAISRFRKVNYTENKKSIDLYYNFTIAFAGLMQKDSANEYFQKALTENVKWNGRRKNTPYGLILKYEADRLAATNQFPKAIATYQSAILQFHNKFNDTDSSKNPDQFSGVFSYINLFNTLAAKAAAFESWYIRDRNIVYLRAALDAYQSAFTLAAYVEKTYDSDEARLFLGKIKYTVHSNPIDICLELYEMTGDQKYLEDAYLFDQRNKASVLAFNVQENELKEKAALTNPSIMKEFALKKSITRLSLKAAQVTDSSTLASINASIRDHEIELGKLQEKLNEDPAWQLKRSPGGVPSIKELQGKLDNNTALLSYHLSGSELLILLVTSRRFEYSRTPTDKIFYAAIDDYKTALHNTSADTRYSGGNSSSILYQKLIKPFQSRLLQVKRLIIIPDDELNYLPFEALRDENQNYLVEKYAVQYQYSTALLGQPKKNIHNPGTLALAPFSEKSYTDSTGFLFIRLPGSNEEISKLLGKKITDTAATKNQFIQSVNKYGTIHLATHASVNNEEPARSFIAFSPADNDFKLYAPEIADLKLDSTQLVILSACETGTGPLVKGEGLMSLSRAFAYAGCPDIITSLWKAEDKATAFLTQRLHFYLDKKFSSDKALQQAKIDLLKNSAMDPRLKSPSFWAHLVFIGEYKPAPINASRGWWVMLPLLIISVTYVLLKRKSLLA